MINPPEQPSEAMIGAASEAIYDFLDERFPDGAMPGGRQLFADDHLDAEFKHEAGCDELAKVALEGAMRAATPACTCPSGERPPVCQHKYALTDCLASAAPVQDDDAEWLRSEIDGAVMPPERRERYRRLLARLSADTALVEEIEELRAFKARVLAAVRFEEPLTSAEIDAAVHADIANGMSLRKCAAKHGLTFGQVRGAARRHIASRGGDNGK